jgi:hypothetical protein
VHVLEVDGLDCFGLQPGSVIPWLLLDELAKVDKCDELQGAAKKSVLGRWVIGSIPILMSFFLR